MMGRRKLRPAQTIAEKMIKVDHAGENGAVNIYRAQHLVSRLRSRQLLDELQHFQSHEMEHRELFADYLSDNNIRRCVSYHLCGVGGWFLGFVTGLIGPSAVMATTYAVENVVLEHLEHQMVFLKDVDNQAASCVEAIIEDEKSHHDHAYDRLNQQQFLPKILIKIVKYCTESVIRFGTR